MYIFTPISGTGFCVPHIKGNTMQEIDYEQLEGFLDCVEIEQSIHAHNTITHICNAGTPTSPVRYTVIVSTDGRVFISPPFFN
jgi:hypothetical protein